MFFKSKKKKAEAKKEPNPQHVYAKEVDTKDGISQDGAKEVDTKDGIPQGGAVPSSVCWISLDPVQVKIDLYPHYIASIIEQAFQNSNENKQCFLGEQFFSATVHFDLEGVGKHCQTTPGVSYGGRGGFYKPQGYRSVRRVELSEDRNLTVYAKRNVSEWRITNEAQGSEKTIELLVPETNIVAATRSGRNSSESRPAAQDEKCAGAGAGAGGSDSQDVPVWQWCMKTAESLSSGETLFNLADQHWGMYMEDINSIIEAAFQEFITSKNADDDNPMSNVAISLGVRQVQIIFDNTMRMFARQVDQRQNKERVVRRKLMNQSEYQNELRALASSLNAGAESCPICLDTFASTATFPQICLPCNHVFHGVCIKVRIFNRNISPHHCVSCSCT